METQYKDSSTYFAALPAERVSGILLGKANSFYNILESNSYLSKLRDMWKAYHGAYGDYVSYGHKVEFTGQEGELVHLPVNHFRNIAQHMINMITSNRPLMEARAINTDYKSLAQTYVANGVLDYYMREKHLEDCLKKAVEMAVVLGSGFIKLDWNATAGEAYDYDEESGEFINEGELEFTNISPFDVVVDGTKESWNNDWIMVRSFRNRYDLIAKYPELKDRIMALPSKTDSSVYRLAIWSNDDTDDVPIYEFYHRRTEAMPDGRYMLFVDADVTLLDTKLPYRVLPIFRITAGEIMGTPYGYSPMFDVFPIQEGINSLYSTILTNQTAFGVQNVFVQRGADLTINTLEGSLNIIEGNAEPKPLNLTQTPKEVFEFLDMLIKSAETISGVNSVARGNPEASLESGTALALIQSMALQFISGLQQSYVRLIEDVGTAIIQILKDFATTPKVIALVGKNNRTLLKEFTGEQISSINRVVVDMGNPLSRTTAGRVQMAEQLLQMKLIHTPEQYFQVINTGRLDVVFEGQTHQLLLIKLENERMMEGQAVRALYSDQHAMHIEEHQAVLSDPDLRTPSPENEAIINGVLTHMQDHINLLRTTDPDLLMILKQQPLNPPMAGSGELPPGPMNAGPNQKSLNGANVDVMTAPDQQPGNSIQSQGGQAQLPSIPKPPPPFESLPTNPADMIPPQ